MNRFFYILALCGGIMMPIMPQLHAEQTTPKEKQKIHFIRWWNTPKTPNYIYRLIELLYAKNADPDIDPTPDLVPVVRLRPDADMLGLYTAEECNEFAVASVREQPEINKSDYRHARRYWQDWDAGIVGVENEDGVYYFNRIICLPSNLIDDLDLVGTQYQMTFKKDNYPDYAHEYVEGGIALLLDSNDERKNIRYDPKRFFARFQEYGVLPVLTIPNTPEHKDWTDTSWNKDSNIKIFPLGTATTLP